MDDEGLENPSKTPGFSNILGLGEAEAEAVRNKSTLRDLIGQWTMLDQAARDII